MSQSLLTSTSPRNAAASDVIRLQWAYLLSLLGWGVKFV